MLKLHPLKVLFLINLVSNISIKAYKKVEYLMPKLGHINAVLMLIFVGIVKVVVVFSGAIVAIEESPTLLLQCWKKKFNF